MNGKTFTTAQAAKILGVAVSTVQAWVENGTLQAWKTVGGHRRIPEHSLEELLRKWQQEEQKKRSQLTILVVDDNAVLAEVYSISLANCGVPVIIEVAKDGFDGLVKIGQKKPDIVITDLVMPGMDGFALIKSLRQNSSLAGVSIVAVTKLAVDEIENSGGLPPDVKIFQKPAPLSDLKEILREKVREKEAVGF